MLNKHSEKQMNIKKSKVSTDFGKRYKAGEINTQRIDSYKIIQLLHDKIFHTDDQTIKKYMKVFHSWIPEFKELFGKQDFCFRYGFNHYGWVIEYKTVKVILFSAKNKGTSIEVIIEEDIIPNQEEIKEIYLEFKNIMENFPDQF